MPSFVGQRNGMNLFNVLAVFIVAILCLSKGCSANTDGTLLSSILIPKDDREVELVRQQRSYYAQRYGFGGFYDTPDYEKPARCARCLDDKYDDRSRDRYDDRSRDRYDDERRQENRPTYGSRFDRNRNDDDNERKYAMDRNNENNNGTDKDGDRGNRTSEGDRYGDRDRNRFDDRDRYGDRDRNGGKDRYYRDRYGDRDRYGNRNRYGDRNNWLDYYDRFGRERPFERRYYSDLYDRERRPLFDRYPYSDPYDYGFSGRYDGNSYNRQFYDDPYDRTNTYDVYGGYGPGFGRGVHDSFRPWDETYRGQAGWDSAGRGYYFASGRPDSAPAAAWGRPDYARPESGWQNVDYSNGYRNQLDYRGAGYPRYDQDVGYGQNTGWRQSGGYRQDLGYRQDTGYGRLSGWHSVGERRLYRDQSGLNQLDNRASSSQGMITTADRGQPAYGQTYGQSPNYDHPASYGQPTNYGQSAGYSQSAKYGQPTNYGQSSTFGQSNNFQNNMATNGFGQTSSTTPATSYLYQREDEHVTLKPADGATKQPS